jgi:large subunit ribosomal protein L9
MGSSKFEVILQQDVPQLGASGELVRVRPGYARNYLIPKGIAVVATARNKAQLEHQKRIALARAAKQHAEAEAMSQKLSEVALTITASAGEDERLYGAVTIRDIAASLKTQGFELDHKVLALEEAPIKRIGSYEVAAKLTSKVTAKFQVNVVAK